MGKYSLEPTVILTIGKYNFINIPYIVSKADGTILDIGAFERIGNLSDAKSLVLTRQQCVKQIEILQNLHKIDMILLEENNLTIDKIDKYPDPLVLKQILFGFGLKISIEDKYFDTIKYIVEIPNYEWRKCVLNNKAMYAIDLFKQHVLNNLLMTDEQLAQAEIFNSYETICLSESVTHPTLMNKKYQINYVKSEVS